MFKLTLLSMCMSQALSKCVGSFNNTVEYRALLSSVYRQRSWDSEKLEITQGHTANRRADSKDSSTVLDCLWETGYRVCAREDILVGKHTLHTSRSLFPSPPLSQLQGHHHTVQKESCNARLSIRHLSLLPSLLAAPKLPGSVSLWQT